jgi:hypothetical protein
MKTNFDPLTDLFQKAANNELKRTPQVISFSFYGFEELVMAYWLTRMRYIGIIWLYQSQMHVQYPWFLVFPIKRWNHEEHIRKVVYGTGRICEVLRRPILHGDVDKVTASTLRNQAKEIPYWKMLVISVMMMPIILVHWDRKA